MTLGKTIFLDPNLMAAAQHLPGLLLVHELVYVRQWGELEVIRFIWRYLSAYVVGRLKALATAPPPSGIPLEVDAGRGSRLPSDNSA